MDSLIYSRPQPFNKYPPGYKPVNDDFSRRLRPSSSWSSFSQIDGRAPLLETAVCASPISPSPFWPDQPRKTFRAESVDNFGRSGTFSPREFSPFSNSSDYYNNDMIRSVRSPPADHYYEPHQDNFSFEKNRNDQEMQFANYFPNVSSFNNANSLPTRPRRTQSDASRDFFPSSNNRQPLNSDQISSSGYQQTNSRPMDGFFRNSLIEPNWMTDPPPPKSFCQDLVYGRSSVPPQQKLSSFEPSSDQNYHAQPNITPAPIPLSHNRVLHLHPQSNSFGRETDRFPEANFSPNRNTFFQNYEPVRQTPTEIRYQNPQRPYSHDRDSFPIGNPPINKRNSFYQGDDFDQRRNEYGFDERVAHGPREISRIASPQTVPSRQMKNSYYQENDYDPRLLNTRLQSSQEIRKSPSGHMSLDRNFSYHQNREKPIPQAFPNHHGHSFTKGPGILSEGSGDLYPHQGFLNQPQSRIERNHQTEPLNQNFHGKSFPEIQTRSYPPPNEEDRIFSPVESKIYNRNHPTVINGFTSDVQRDDQFNNKRELMTRSKRNSMPPIAVIEPQAIAQSPSYRFSQTLGQNKVSLPSYRSPSVSVNSWSPAANLSPVSTYDNESDIDADLPISRFNMAQMQKRNDILTKRNGFGDSLQGILIKRPVLHKSSKKVVFCDQRRGSGAQQPADVPAHVRAYDDAMESVINRWAQLSDKIGGDAAVMKTKAINVFDALRSFLWTAAGQPEPGDVQKLVAPIVEQLNGITEFKDSKRNTPLFNHLSAVAEGIPAVGWILIKKTPAPYVKEMLDASMFYINRILKEYKDTNTAHTEWVRSWKELLEEMQKFVRQTHTTGLVWNSAPGSVPTQKPAAPKSGGAPPPPPPPPPADLFANVPPPAAGGEKASRDALFAELNKGEAITSGLRKVTSDMQTHKNPSLRGSGAPAPGTAKTASGPAKTAAPVQKPPKIELQDYKQWNIEYHIGNKNINIDITDKKQTVYIFRCEGSVIKINGKANSITLDGCKKTSVVFDAVVGQCETINCQSVQIQTLGEMPTLSIQKTDGCQVYLSKASKGAEIVTSKSSEMNILLPTDDDDFVEHPVPEQFKSTFVNGKLVTSEFEVLDYLGPVAVGIIFTIALILISFFAINFFCITKYDDLTKFELLGGRLNMRLGPHPLTVIRKGGFVAREDIEEAERIRREAALLQ
ncbi:unnamed protein product [Caenorhabditis auriculariae]|uniref:C-CAP/cofactor C-like domain-containing protein n=1 Tax=Caenorhabditis auriculariae TaxID=2777116 RepID=A0A8S1GYN7_9PELO|nr:unnamed protein product [Caenorhabditis auriculariae]